MSFLEFNRVPNNCGIWKKLKPVNSDRWLRILLHAYLDEDTKNRPEEWDQLEEDAPEPERKKAVAAGKAPLRPGKDFTPLSSGIWTFGHVAAKMNSKGLSLTKANKQETIRTVGDWWTHDRKDSAVKAHHIVASFDPRISSELHRRGYPVDAMLLSSFHQTISQFGARFYPETSLGWIAGCHHDRANPHVHALLHPTDSSGKLLRLSGLKDGEQGEDKFNYLHKTFNTRSRQLFVGLTLGGDVSKKQMDLMVNQWLLLSRQAMIQANPTSVDAPYAASELLRKWLETGSYQEHLASAARDATTTYQISTPAVPDAKQLGSRWSEIIDTWHTRREGHLSSAMDVIKVMKTGKEYQPTTSTISTPTAPSSEDYLQIAGQGMRSLPTTLVDALKARKAQSERHRIAFNLALKNYRASIEQTRKDMDAITVQSGFAMAQIELQVGVHAGKPPAFVEFSEPGKSVPRMIPSVSRSEAFAEREMSAIASTEAAAHQPEDPMATPSLLATDYAPRFRELTAPSRHLTDMAPTL